jgi:hypothetical protein
MAFPGITGGEVATTTNEYGSGSGVVNNALSNVTGGWADALAPKASEIFETRSATRIFDSHQDIALKSIEGSEFPTFTENENLYGFTIFQFKQGFWGGGWSKATINSLLGFDLGGIAASALGGDQIAGVNSYFFNMHPQEMSVTEPFATQLMPTQGGGVYAESQGSILRTLTLSGTTGYRPSRVHTVTSNLDNVIPHELNEPTGYLNFLKLRNVFRNYSDLKKTKTQSYKTYLIWFNNKEQEAWFFEPSSFTTSRSASSPFTYNYTISGTLIQKVNFSSVVNTIAPDPGSVHFWISSMRRGAGLINGIAGKLGYGGIGSNLVGDVLQATGSFLGYIDELDQTLRNAVELGAGIAGMGTTLLTTIMASAQDVKRSTNELLGDESYLQTVFGTNPNRTAQALKDLLNFDKALRDTTQAAIALNQPELLSDILSNTGLNFSIGSQASIAYATGGQFFNEEEFNWVPVHVSGDDQSLEEFVNEKLGDSSATQAVAIYNGLSYPYLSATPTYGKGLSKFVTAGDVIFLPFEKEIVSGDINTKININKMSGNINEEILGRDLDLTKTTHATTGVSEFNLTINPHGDLAIVGGKKNILQAIDIKLNTERGELSPHPEFGIVPLMGRKGTNNLTFNLYLSLNDTMLSDGRIKELTNTSVRVIGDIVYVNTRVNVIGTIPYVPLKFSMSN